MADNIKTAEVQKGFTFTDECLVGFDEADYSASFYDNVQTFLAQSCEKVDNDNVEYPTWFTTIAGPAECDKITLYIAIQDMEKSSLPFCSTCKTTGWGHHFVSREKYHFWVPEKKFSEIGYPLLNNVAWAKALCLNGVIHSNGFGHLYPVVAVTLKFPSEEDLTNLWDFLCSRLKTRAISKNVNGQNEHIEQKTWNIEEEHIDDEDDDGKIINCEAIPDHYRIPASPGVLLSVSAGISKGRLQDMIQKALRRIFCVTKQYTVTDIEGMEEIDDAEDAPVTFGQVLRVKGEGLTKTLITFEDGEILER